MGGGFLRREGGRTPEMSGKKKFCPIQIDSSFPSSKLDLSYISLILARVLGKWGHYIYI